MRKQILMAIIWMVTAGTVLSAQEKTESHYADTLHITVADDLRLMLLSENISKFQPSDSLNLLFKTIDDDLLKIELPDLEDGFTQIFYGVDESGNVSIRFKDVQDEDRVYEILENGETLDPMLIELILKLEPGTALHCFMNGIEGLESISNYDVESILSEILAKQKELSPEIKRLPMTEVWNVENGKPAQASEQSYKNTPSMDQISLTGTVGASLIRNRLVPSFDFVVGVSLAKKARMKHMINADFSMNYIFNEKAEGGFSTDINSFIGLSYFLNFSQNPDKSQWLGVGVSYLVWRNGDFFDENTWRITVGAKFKDRFSIMPEIYVSDGFKNVMPGLKFKVWF